MNKVFALALSALAYSSTYAIAQEAAKDFETAFRWYTESLQEGDTKAALQYSEEAYTFGKEKFGEVSRNAAVLALNYSKMLSIEKFREEAATLATEARIIADQIYTEPSRDIVMYLVAETQALMADYETDKAQEAVNRAIKITKDIVGDDTLEYAGILHLRAQIDAISGWGSKARKDLERALDIYATQLEHDDPRIAAINFDLGRYQLAWKRYERATTHLSKAVETWSYSRANHLEDIGSARAFMVTAYTEMGEIDKATEQCQAIGLEMVERGDGNAEAQPLYRKVPKYPISASQRGAEGWVQLSFTIDQLGFVQDIDVVDIEGRDAFGIAAKEALTEWRYAPAVIDGEFVPRPDNKVIITFELDS